jgi:hypothetical protein
MATIEQIKELLSNHFNPAELTKAKESLSTQLNEANEDLKHLESKLRASETVIAKQILELARRDADALRRRSVKPLSFMEWLEGPHHPADLAQFALLVGHPAVQAELTYYKVYPTRYYVRKQGTYNEWEQVPTDCANGDYPKSGTLTINATDYGYLISLVKPLVKVNFGTYQGYTAQRSPVIWSNGFEPVRRDWPSITNGGVLQGSDGCGGYSANQPISADTVTRHYANGKWEEHTVEARPIYAKMLDLIHNLYQEYRDSLLDE